MLLYHFRRRRRWIIFHTYFVTRKKTREIYYYFCLQFRLIFRLFFSFVFASLGAGVHSLHHISIALRFHILFLSVFRLTFRMFGMREWRSSCYWLHVYCVVLSFTERNSLFLFVVSCIVPKPLHSRSPPFHSQTVKCRVYLTLSWESKNVHVCMF